MALRRLRVWTKPNLKARLRSCWHRRSNTEVMKLSIVTCVLIVVLVLCGGALGQQTAALPQISLPKLDGQALRSDDLNDRIVVLDFWATWCENCVNEIPE